MCTRFKVNICSSAWTSTVGLSFAANTQNKTFSHSERLVQICIQKGTQALAHLLLRAPNPKGEEMPDQRLQLYIRQKHTTKTVNWNLSWQQSYLGFPLHPSYRDSQQQDDGQSPNDPNVIELISHQGINVLQPIKTWLQHENPSSLDREIR